MDHILSTTIPLSKLREIYRLSWNSPKARKKILALIDRDIVEYCGLKYIVRPNNNFTDQRIWATGESPEKQCINTVLNMLKAGTALFIDIGANSGSYSLPIAKSLEGRGEVIAFEPNPYIRESLSANIKLNSISNITVSASAVGASSGSQSLMIVNSNWGETTLHEATNPKVEKILVDVIPLEEIIAAHQGYEIKAIKIDIEGYEDRVFEHFFETVTPELYPNIILIETRHKNEWAFDLVTEFKKRGYQPIFKMEGNTLFLLEG